MDKQIIKKTGVISEINKTSRVTDYGTDHDVLLLDGFKGKKTWKASPNVSAGDEVEVEYFVMSGSNDKGEWSFNIIKNIEKVGAKQTSESAQGNDVQMLRVVHDIHRTALNAATAALKIDGQKLSIGDLIDGYKVIKDRLIDDIIK